MEERREDEPHPARAREQEQRKAPYKCCLESFDTPTFLGSRHVRRRPGQRRAGLHFKMLATFRSELLPSPEPVACVCFKCEYRQHVRGFFMLDGEDMPHPLTNGEVLDRVEWREDGKTVRLNGIDHHANYGHRDQPAAHLIDTYRTSRERGCEYEGQDYPSLTGSRRAQFEINLEFRGRIIDTASGAIVDTRYWAFRMKGRLSRRSKYWE